MSKQIQKLAASVGKEPGQPSTNDVRGWTSPYKPRFRMVAFVDKGKSDK